MFLNRFNVLPNIKKIRNSNIKSVGGNGDINTSKFNYTYLSILIIISISLISLFIFVRKKKGLNTFK